MKTTHKLNLPAAALALAAAGARAGETDHYGPGLPGIRDYFVPDPGFYGTLYRASPSA